MIQNKFVLRSIGLLSLLLMAVSVQTVSAQKKQPAPVDPAKLLTQRTTRHETQRFGFGGTISIVGAPDGAITVEGWQRNEVEVTAEIELKAETQEDLRVLSQVNTFVFDQDLNHLRLLSTGTHDKDFMRRVDKKFPKRLLGLPWKIAYRVRVPFSTDLEIDAGRGPIRVSGLEGAIRVSAVESDTSLELTGGTLMVTIAKGTVDLKVPVRSWRGAGAEVRVVTGALTVEFASGFNGDIDADVLRLGAIENTFEPLASRERPGITPRQIKGRAGSGGAFFRFTVGDGTIVIKKGK